MQDIFGDVNELLELYTERKAAAVLGRDESAEDLAAPEDEDDEEALAAYQQQLACILCSLWNAYHTEVVTHVTSAAVARLLASS